MSNEEANSLYLYTVRDYHVSHKWDAGGTPSQVMEMQEMGVDGQGSATTGTSDVFPPSVGVHTDMTGESSSGGTCVYNPSSHT
jgi:hypothetical protein